jgi:hypothetical protein
VRAHSLVRTTPRRTALHRARRVSGSSCTAVQKRTASGSGACPTGYTDWTRSPSSALAAPGLSAERDRAGSPTGDGSAAREQANQAKPKTKTKTKAPTRRPCARATIACVLRAKGPRGCKRGRKCNRTRPSIVITSRRED